jgi:hypothetical protein
MKTQIGSLLAAFLLAIACTVHAADWPQFRGPNRDDISKEKNLLKSWPEGGPRLLWTIEDAGVGYSGPAIVGDRLYTMGGTIKTETAADAALKAVLGGLKAKIAEDRTESVYAIDLNTQKKIWSTEIGPFYPHGNGDGPRGTPTVNGDALYCLTGHGELLCVALKDGNIRWRINLKKDLDGDMASGWGYSESVLVDGDKVVCTPGGKKGTLAALNKADGKLIWRSDEWTAKATYSSIIIAEIGGVKQYVQVTGSGVGGVAAADGKLLWKSDQSAHGISVSTPVYKDNQVYVSTGYGVGCGVVKISHEGDTFKTEKVYDQDEMKLMVNHHGGFVLLGDFVYGFSDSKGWICQEFATGKLIWPDDKDKTKAKPKDFDKGSLTCADGHLYCYTENGGKVALVEASPDGWKETGRFTIPMRSHKNTNQNAWTHPVVANGKLYLRDQEFIFCYDISDGGK